ncbi:hypothetical protein FRC08_003193 [Ceratobasidium sp. 394]|nr:hypothetical protein FRC08_003193 [Ceratobasidium sp. 394]
MNFHLYIPVSPFLLSLVEGTTRLRLRRQLEQEAHENAMVVAKGLATVGLRVLLDPEFCQAAKDAFKNQSPR